MLKTARHTWTARTNLISIHQQDGRRFLSEKINSLLTSRVNAPTTLPPPLTLPDARKPEQYRIAWAYKVGKSYLQFYKTGFKQILGNRKTAKLIRARHLNDPRLSGIPGSIVDHTTGQLITAQPGHSDKLSRAEYQFLKRHAKDIKKVPIFAVLLAIFGEWLPLFVIFLDPLIPGTVLLPIQISKRRRKASKMIPGSVATITPHHGAGDLEGSGIHDRAGLIRVAKRFSLLGPVSRFLPDSAILKRIRRHETYLSIDDALLQQDLTLPMTSVSDNDESLNADEIELAIEERGMWTESQNQEERVELLNQWLQKDRNKVFHE